MPRTSRFNASFPLGCASFAAFALVSAALAQVAPHVPANLVEVGGHATDHILIQLASGVVPGLVPGVASGVVSGVASDPTVGAAKGEPLLRAVGRNRAVADQLAVTSARALRDAGVIELRSIFVEPPRDMKTARAIGLDRWYRAILAPGRDCATAAAKLRRLTGLVSRADLDGEGGLAEIPNDPQFTTQYALRNTGQVIGGVSGLVGADIGATAAWNVTHGNNMIIAVLDSGIDPHGELAGRILPGINVPDGNNITLDECNHGTHVAGIIAASGNNATGMAGLSWNARLLPVVVVNGCTGFEANVASGLTWAVDHGARLVNMSLQFYAFNPVFLQAVQYANAQGALMVAATGNSSNGNVAAPAKWNETIAVAATDNLDQRASFSNFGPEVDIAAPGVNVWSLSGTTNYAFKSGTSMSAPHVTGAAALLWSYNPSLTRDQVRALLIAGAKDLGDPGTDPFYGAGRLDIAASIALAPPPTIPEDLDANGVIDARDLAILLTSWGACLTCDACPADLDGDCTVGAADLARLLSVW